MLFPAWYPLLFQFADAAAVGTTLQQAIRVADSLFCCTAILVATRVDDTGALIAATDVGGFGGGTFTEVGGPIDPAVTLQFTETGSQRNYVIGGPQSLDAWFFSHARPLPQPIWVNASSQIQVTVALLKLAEAARGLDVRVTFEGYHDDSRMVAPKG